jgi:ubiquinone/menaquinone biosynthesis C-methylase UbiE
MEHIWQSADVASRYLKEVRAAIPLAGEQIEIMLRLVARARQPVKRFLDVGCGDGVLSHAMLDRFPESSAVLVDFSAPMLEAAAGRLGEYGSRVVIGHIDYGEPGWAKRLPPGPPFHAVISGYSIHHQTDLGKHYVYSTIFDLLAPGGMFVNIEHVQSPSEWIRGAHDDVMVDSLHRLQPERPREEIAREYLDRGDRDANILSPLEAQCGWLREIGFQDVDCYLKIFELAAFGGRKPV